MTNVNQELMMYDSIHRLRLNNPMEIKREDDVVLIMNFVFTFPTSDGIFKALVANPIPKAMASSVPRNFASRDSNF